MIAVLLAACVVGLAALSCDSVAPTVKNAARVADELATVVAREGGGNLAPPVRAPVPADVQEVSANLQRLAVAERGSDIDYDRDDWNHWVDADRDCQNTRAEVLIAESLSPVSFASDDNCRVVGGEWVGPWSGETFTDASDVDIDHHVPLGHAHESGGWGWDRDRKRAYANDMGNPASLQATKASLNRTKGKQPPDQWRPANERGWCRYAAGWIDVKSTWTLTVTADEKRALSDMLDTCGDAGSWGRRGVQSP